MLRQAANRSFFARSIPGVIALFVLAGCATWSAHGINVASDRKVRLAVLPVQSDVVIDKLKDIETLPEGTQEIPNEQEQIRNRMEQAAEGMTLDIETRLAAGPFFEVVPPEETKRALEAQGLRPGNPVTPEQAQKIGTGLGAQAVLITRLSGYGRLKKAWVAYLIGSGVVEGVVEGVLVGGATKQVWIGVVVASEEILQEVLTWGGGAYLFNLNFSPVIIEGRLISPVDKKTVWSDTAYHSIDRKALKKLPETERKRKEIQLKVTAESTIRALVESLEKAAKKQQGK